MDRKLIKALISEIVQEISADTAQRASEKAASLGRPQQSKRLDNGAIRKRVEQAAPSLDKLVKKKPTIIGITLTKYFGQGHNTNHNEEDTKPTKVKLLNVEIVEDSVNMEYVVLEGPLKGNRDGFITVNYGPHRTQFMVEPYAEGYAVGQPKFDRNGIIFIRYLTGLPVNKIPRIDSLSENIQEISADTVRNAADKLPDYTKFDRDGVIAMHKLTGLPNEKIPKLDKMKQENRDLVKAAVRKLVLKELTQANFGVGKISSEEDLVGDVKKSVGKSGEAIENPLSGKVSVDDKKGGNAFQAEITENGKGLFDVNVVTNGSDRKVGRQLSAEKLAEFLKDAVKDDKSYTDKARTKSLNSGPEKKEPKKVVKVDDEMEESDEDTQKDIADDNDVKAEEKHEKEVSALNKDNAPQLGGEIVDKIEKIIDRVLKNKAKAETKTAFLKTDSKMESPDKLTAKLKDTPALKK